MPGEVLHTDEFTPVLQDYCGALHAEGAFAGLLWADAKQIAAAVSFDVRTRDNAAEFLRNRARNTLADRQHGLTGPREGDLQLKSLAMGCTLP